MSSKEPGYVYILTNPSFREDWVKIGKSSRPVDVRSKELDNTAVPLPFEIFHTKSPKARGWSFRTIYKMVQFYETYSSQGFNEIVNHYGMQQYQSKSDQRELPDKKSVFMPIELAQIANDVMPSICG